VSFLVNGNVVGGSSDLTAQTISGALSTPIYINVAPSLLRAGENVIHVRMRGTSARMDMHGLAPVIFGNAREVRKVNIAINEIGFQAQRTFFVMAFTAGLIAIFVWFARRSDRVMLWFGITCLSWAAASIPRLALRWMDLPNLTNVLAVYVDYGLVVPTIILCLRIVNLSWPRIEAALWAFLIVVATYPLWWSGSSSTLSLIWDAASTALLLFGIVIIVAYSKGRLRWSEKVQVIALLLMAALMFSEVMRYFGWIPVDAKVLRHYHVPLMLFAIGAAIFERHVVAIWRMEQTNVDLERRVAEKTREIEAFHAEREEVMRQQTLARERQRIVTDMHDGLGASLVALLRYVQSKRPDPHIEQRVKEALQELRISIDALEPSAGDLGAVLGNLRYRLEPLLEPVGVHLEWDVAELPQIESLEPTAVFALQRIVLEAVANALKHSGASRVRLSAQAAPGGGVEIRVEDDGRGFDPSHSSLGTGLRNMRARAARIGVRLEISSSTGSGTAISLLIPRRLPDVTEDQASGKPDPRVLHGLVPATGVA
jgi:signal transduction histidine kinase